MFTLYDLLDADPQADKRGLKEAFRKAARASHPDVNPDDADAAWRFRQIARAHEILSDDELRAAYDHVVAFEQRMQESAASPILDNVLAKIVSGTVTAAVVAIVLFSGYQLSAHFAEAPVAAATVVDTAPPRLATGHDATDRAETADAGVGPVLAALHAVTIEAAVPATLKQITEPATPDSAGHDAAAPLEKVPDRARRDARFFHTRGLLAYRFGDFDRALANFDAAIRRDPRFERAWRDRAAVFSLTGRFDRAAIDLAQADRIKSAQPTVKHHVGAARAAAHDAQREIQRFRPSGPFVLARPNDKVPWPAGG